MTVVVGSSPASRAKQNNSRGLKMTERIKTPHPHVELMME